MFFIEILLDKESIYSDKEQSGFINYNSKIKKSVNGLWL